MEEIKKKIITELPEATTIENLYTLGTDKSAKSVKVPIGLLKGNKGDKGDAPYAGTNGNWWVGSADTGVPTVIAVSQAKGQDTAKAPSLKLFTDTALEFDSLQSKLYADYREIPFQNGTVPNSNDVRSIYYQDQAALRGKAINIIKVKCSASGTFSVLRGKNINSGSYTSEVVKIFSVIVGENILDVNIILGSDEWIGFYASTDTSKILVKDGANPVGGGYYYIRSNTWGLSQADLCIGIYTQAGDIPQLHSGISNINKSLSNTITYLKSKNEDISAAIRLKEKTGVYIITPASTNDIIGRYMQTGSNFVYVDKYRLLSNTRYDIQIEGILYPKQGIVFLYDTSSATGASEYYYFDEETKKVSFKTKEAVYMSFQIASPGDSLGSTNITSYSVIKYVADAVIVPFVERTGIYITRTNSSGYAVGSYLNSNTNFRIIDKVKLHPNTEYTIRYDPNQKPSDTTGLFLFLYDSIDATSASKYYVIENGKITFTTTAFDIYVSLQTAVYDPETSTNFNIAPTLVIQTEGIAYSLSVDGSDIPLSSLINSETGTYEGDESATIQCTNCVKVDASTPVIEDQAKFYKVWIDGDVLKTKLPVNLKERLVLNDEPFELIIKNNNNIHAQQEASIIEVDGEIRIYYTGIETVTRNRICFCTIDLNTKKIKNHLEPVLGLGFGGAPSNREANCSHVFKYGEYIYCVATNGYGIHESGVYLYRSVNGISFESLGALHNSSVTYKAFGNNWIIPEAINGEYYWFYEGHNGGNWEMSVAKSSNIEGPYTKIGKISGIGIGGMGGGQCVYYYNNKFRMFYHYGLKGNLPTVLGYAEAELSSILQFTNKYTPLLGITRAPFGENTDQLADPAIYELNGNIYMIAEYAMNSPYFDSRLYLWEAKGLSLNRLFD